LKAVIDVGRPLNVLVSHYGLNADEFSVPKLSFPSDIPTVKIDYIFVSKDLLVSGADIPEIISSDHRPHVAIIEGF
jgi:endonuclease/exonuclease/phosphatase family metal-dependent hydrolase